MLCYIPVAYELRREEVEMASLNGHVKIEMMIFLLSFALLFWGVSSLLFLLGALYSSSLRFWRGCYMQFLR